MLDKLSTEVVDFYTDLPQQPVTQPVTPDEIRTHLAQRYDFGIPVPLDQVVDDVARMMRQWNVHTTHPRYFGLFNPTANLASIIADALAALYNPQLGVWSHAPAANEIEQFTLRYLMGDLGLDPATSCANFTAGGSEANLSAVLAALTHRFPDCGDDGLMQTLSARPLIYVSEEAHDSFAKIAHITGLGRNALRVIPTDDRLKMDVSTLSSQLEEDKAAGQIPFMVVGTAGTTGAGVIDPLPELAAFCQTHRLWFHVDAAWGGAAALSPRLRGHLQGIESADSITCDAHKWFSVSMGAGMFFCRHRDAVARTFRVSAGYMPGATGDTVDPYTTTIQWSRRFIGLKLFMTLAESGTDQLAAQIEHQADMGELLRRQLAATGWSILNDTPLPVVCFTHPQLAPDDLPRVLEQLNARQAVWISETRLKRRIPALRACITSFRTQAEDVAFLVQSLNDTLHSMPGQG
jgi:glutamate/tyrosine decarboxylase-like PLP-dependent enzyme